MKFDLSTIVRPSILKVKSYSSARDEFSGGDASYIFLDANENPYGSIGNTLSYNRYPDPYQKIVKTRLAEIKGVAPQQIFLGNGSDESIDLIYRIFCIPGVDNVITLPPTYGMYAVSAGINDIGIKEVSLTPDFQLNTEAIVQAIDGQTKIIWVCSPNNPTGCAIDKNAIIQLLNTFKGIVVVDEAYIDFCPEKSCADLLNTYPNLIITQTFSKAWGLANLRLGIAFASEEIISIFNKVKPPYNINGYTQMQALRAMENEDEKNRIVQKIIDNRNELIFELEKLPIVEHIYPSESNQLLVRIKEADHVYERLVNKKIIVRNRAKVLLCEGCLRFTIGTDEENAELIRELAVLS